MTLTAGTSLGSNEVEAQWRNDSVFLNKTIAISAVLRILNHSGNLQLLKEREDDEPGTQRSIA